MHACLYMFISVHAYFYSYKIYAYILCAFIYNFVCIYKPMYVCIYLEEEHRKQNYLKHLQFEAVRLNLQLDNIVFD